MFAVFFMYILIKILSICLKYVHSKFKSYLTITQTYFYSHRLIVKCKDD